MERELGGDWRLAGLTMRGSGGSERVRIVKEASGGGEAVEMSVFAGLNDVAHR
ncbi:hypothetical protein [Paenibacillus glycanilyticus]|uniref:hypothetical protein n=1 Tax=Paenibacillus glycanilyticus TaxID=126569 RepID=UPI003EBD532C